MERETIINNINKQQHKATGANISSNFERLNMRQHLRPEKEVQHHKLERHTIRYQFKRQINMKTYTERINLLYATMLIQYKKGETYAWYNNTRKTSIVLEKLL